jgi:hypothetical protein
MIGFPGMDSDIDKDGRLTTGESVEEYINRKAQEDPELFEIAQLGEPPINPL